jgi:hypothetical protein
VKHFASRRFWDAYDALPASARSLADQSFELLKRDPGSIPSSQEGGPFLVGARRPRYRALAVEAEEGLVWFWIGSHAEYDRLIEQA